MSAALTLCDPRHKPVYRDAGRHRRARHAKPRPVLELLAVAVMLAVTVLGPAALVLMHAARTLGLVLLGAAIATYLPIGAGA